jgi:hypothetical protein
VATAWRHVREAVALLAKVVPLVPRTNRTAIGSLARQVDLSGDWDSPQTNAEMAAGFGIGE